MAWFPFTAKKESTDYEKVLSELDAAIHKAEVRLSEIKIRERRAGALWLLYSTIVWTSFLLYGFFTFNRQSKDISANLWTLTPIIAIPVGIYYAKRTLTWFYARKRNYEEFNLNSLRAKQRMTVEELKNKTAYYTTKALLERFDLEAKRQDEDHHLRRLASAPPSMRAPNPRPDTPSPQRIVIRPPLSPQPGLTVQARRDLREPPVIKQQQIAAPPPKLRELREQQWYDKLIDVLVGEQSIESQYALICRFCYSHNGLVTPEQADIIQYICPQCKKFNPAKKDSVSKPSNAYPALGSPHEKLPLSNKPDTIITSRALEDKIDSLRISDEEDEKVSETTLQ